MGAAIAKLNTRVNVLLKSEAVDPLQLHVGWMEVVLTRHLVGDLSRSSHFEEPMEQ